MTPYYIGELMVDTARSDGDNGVSLSLVRPLIRDLPKKSAHHVFELSLI